MFELPIEVPGKRSRSIIRDLHRQMRAAILDGRLPPLSRLPSTREFALRHGVSRNTAVAIYELLLSEGYFVHARAQRQLCVRPPDQSGGAATSGQRRQRAPNCGAVAIGFLLGGAGREASDP